jgi:DNA-binding transcriptional ArsR family regulator
MSKKAAPELTDHAIRSRAGLFKLASDPVRLRVILLLEAGERNVGELCAATDFTQPAMSHHLSLLRVSRVAETRRAGKNNYYSLTALGEAIARAARAMDVN